MAEGQKQLSAYILNRSCVCGCCVRWPRVWSGSSMLVARAGWRGLWGVEQTVPLKENGVEFKLNGYSMARVLV